MAAQRRMAAAALSCAAALAIVCVVLQPSAAPGDLESVSARMAGADARGRTGQGRLQSLLGGKPAHTPESFSRTAERVRLESAIKIAAEKLEQEKEHRARLQTEHEAALQIAAEKLEQEKEHRARLRTEHEAALQEFTQKSQVAHHLRERSSIFAEEAVEKRTVSQVESDKADTEGKEEQLETRIATLMAYKAQNLKERAAAQLSKEQAQNLKERAAAQLSKEQAAEEHAEELKQIVSSDNLLAAAEHAEELKQIVSSGNLRAAAEHAEELKQIVSELERMASEKGQELKQIVSELERMANEKGQHADAIVASAKGLLASARDMAREAEEQAGQLGGAARSTPEMEADQKELAEAEIKLKNMVGVEGVDETSRAQEAIQESSQTADELRARSADK
ncbi:hypothetical protein T484DRAFT_1787268 [Baffinella frigidus]|nr:hypothetical protein T484DRAFT_1787268 [Cryptophyta sp. CCMP2293]